MTKYILPKLKKKVSTFITEEKGEITKEGVFKVGVVISALSIGAMENTQKVLGQGETIHSYNYSTSTPEPPDCPASVANQIPKIPDCKVDSDECSKKSGRRNPINYNVDCNDEASGHYNYLSGIEEFSDPAFNLKSIHEHCLQDIHAQHSQHCSHASHGSHGSHGQW